MTEITDQLRNKRSSNIQSVGCIEVICPSCKGKGSMNVRSTRIAGSAMNKHREEKHDPETCGCPRSTVSSVKKCIRCGGYGTVPRRESTL